MENNQITLGEKLWNDQVDEKSYESKDVYQEHVLEQ